MDVNRFIDALVSRLEASGADRVSAIRASRIFVGKMPDDEAVQLAAHADNEVIDRIAAALIKDIRPSNEVKKDPIEAFSLEDESGADPDDDDDDMIDAMLSPKPRQQQPANIASYRQRSVSIPEQSAHQRTPAQPVRRQQISQRPPQAQQAQQMQSQQRGQQISQRPPQTSQAQQMQSPQRRQVSQPQPTQQIKPAPVSRQTQSTGAQRPHKGTNAKAAPKRRVIHKPDPNADYSKFYTILVCTSPLWGFAALCGAAAFVLAIGALAALIVFLIVGLFAGVAVGTILSLVGVIYGITQLFEYAPIGIYEIGLGLMIGGFVMFFGILAYNAAIRLLPYLIKQVLVLFSFTLHKCVELYYHVKGRCADL